MLGGCDRLLGLDPVTTRDASPGDAGATDAATATTRRTVRWSEFRYRADFTITELDASGQQATSHWLIDDASSPSGLREVPMVVGPGNRLQADLPRDAAATLVYAQPDGVPVYLTLAATDLEVAIGYWGAANATEAPPDAMVVLALDLPTPFVAGESFRYDVIGPYLGATLQAPAAPSIISAEILPADLSTVVGVPMLFQADDVIVVSRAATVGDLSTLTGVFQREGLTQHAGPTPPIAGALMAVVHDHQLTLIVDGADDATRIDAVAPPFPLFAEGWTISATPLTPLTSQGIRLTGGGVVPPEGVVVAYGNPFAPRWPAVLNHHRFKYRSVTPDDVPALNADVRLAAGFLTLATPPGPGEGLVTITRPQALPTAVSLGGTTVDTDGQEVPLPTGDAAVTIDVGLDGDGTCDIVGAVLAEFVPDGARVVRTNRAIIRGQTGHFRVPRAALQANVPYVVRAECFVGPWPNLADGDLVTRALPYNYGYRDSPVFVIDAP